MKGVIPLAFFVCSVVIVFLAVQVNGNTYQVKEDKILDQGRIKTANRMLLRSAATSHPIFAHEEIMEAKFIIDLIVTRYGSIHHAEDTLKMPAGEFQALVDDVNTQHEVIQKWLMAEMIKARPELNVEANKRAGLNAEELIFEEDTEKSHIPSPLNSPRRHRRRKHKNK